MSTVEKAVLGAVLLNEKAYEEIAALTPEDFSLDAHRRIFERMQELRLSQHPIDLATLEQELDVHNELELIGGIGYLSSLIVGLPERTSLSHYVVVIRESAARKRAARLAEVAQKQAEDGSVSLSAVAETVKDLAEVACRLESPPPRYSEEALALRFSRKYADELRYVHRWVHWMKWQGTRWVEDDTLHVLDLARGVCRAASAELGASDKAISLRLASKATSSAIERLAATDRRHAATPDEWDSDPWILNTPTGTVDLRTGVLREHRRSDYLTKITAAGPAGSCPLWLKVLDRIAGGDAQLVAFLQLMVGYALTGSTREQCFFFLHGTGANGKSLFLSTIAGLLGDYARTAPASSFTASLNEQHPTDIAGLRGARLVTAAETENEARWAESKIKSLTGGDKIAARFMRCDFFEFIPQFKLVVAGNNKPSLHSVGEAMRRRLYLVPFTVTIPKEERDPTLLEKLRAEYPGILAWAIEGCLIWQRDGLTPPAVVRDATADYLESEDVLGRWVDDRCVADKQLWTPVGSLFASWQAYCRQAGEREGSMKHFVLQLEARGFQRQRTRHAKGFVGIGLKGQVVPDVPGNPIFPVTGTRARTPNMPSSGTSGTATAKEPAE